MPLLLIESGNSHCDLVMKIKQNLLALLIGLYIMCFVRMCDLGNCCKTFKSFSLITDNKLRISVISLRQHEHQEIERERQIQNKDLKNNFSTNLTFEIRQTISMLLFDSISVSLLSLKTIMTKMNTGQRFILNSHQIINCKGNRKISFVFIICSHDDRTYMGCTSGE